jgi:hypothetical protein
MKYKVRPTTQGGNDPAALRGAPSFQVQTGFLLIRLAALHQPYRLRQILRQPHGCGKRKAW